MSAIAPEELDRYLAEFIRSVRRKDGGEYEPSSLRSLMASIEQHLKKNNYLASVFSDRQFELTQRCLQSKQKELKKAGHGNMGNYSSLNLNQQKNVSSILSRTSQTQTATSTGANKVASTSKTLMNFFEGAAISGGHISISINTLITSPIIQSESCITETERRWKRIRIEESDSD